MSSTAQSKRASLDREVTLIDTEVLLGAGDVAARLDEAYLTVIGLAGAHDFPLAVVIDGGLPKIRLSDFNELLKKNGGEGGEDKQYAPSPKNLTKETITQRWFQAEIREAIFRNEARNALNSLIQFAASIQPSSGDGGIDLSLLLLQSQAMGTSAHTHTTIESTVPPPPELDFAPPATSSE